MRGTPSSPLEWAAKHWTKPGMLVGARVMIFTRHIILFFIKAIYSVTVTYIYYIIKL